MFTESRIYIVPVISNKSEGFNSLCIVINEFIFWLGPRGAVRLSHADTNEEEFLRLYGLMSEKKDGNEK